MTTPGPLPDAGEAMPEPRELDGTPVCPGCLLPVDPARYYCARCGWDTGTFTPFIPFVNIW